MSKLPPENLVQRTERSVEFNLPPPGWLKAHLKAGDFVKIIIGHERCWVQLTEIVDDDNITGTINNDLHCGAEHGWSLGDPISLTRQNIFDYTRA